MNYELKNDHELSSAVLSIKVLALGYKPNIRPSIPHEGGSSNAYCGNTLENFDINNPADMWPIAFENNISVINIKNTTQWFACGDVEFENICMSPDGSDNGISHMTSKYESYCANPLRAAAIVFLKMQEAK
jgi:hypothetical protein